MRVGLIGYGYWCRTCCAICRKRPARKCSGAPTSDPRDATDIFEDPDVDAVVLATPVNTHYALARQALERGKHVLVEKPMTRTVAEGEELAELADKKGLVLMVDHTFIYTGAVHDLSILTYLIDKKPEYVCAVGADHTGSGFADMAYLTCNFPIT